MFSKGTKIVSSCGIFFKQLWQRMCAMPVLFIFLTILQIVMGGLMMLLLEKEIPLTLWLGGYIVNTAILMLLPALLPQRWWRLTWTVIILVLSGLLFIYEYYLLTRQSTLLTQTVVLQYLTPRAEEVRTPLLLWSIPICTLLEALGLLIGMCIVTWLIRKRAILASVLLVILIFGSSHIIGMNRLIADGITNDEAHILSHEYNMVSRFIGTTLGVFADQARYTSMGQHLLDNQPKDVNVVPHRAPHNVVVIIGESLRRIDMHCYGYPLENTPHLDSLVRAGSLILYDDVVCPQPNTITSLRRVLTLRSQDEDAPWDSTSTLPLTFSAAGYKTYWCSNQEMSGDWIEEVSLIAATSDSSYYTDASTSSAFLWKVGHEKYDELILPHLIDYRQTSSPNGSLFVVTHLMGNHAAFKSRYPDEQFSHFTAEDLSALEPHLSTGEAVNSAEYMNSILYNDSIVSEIINYYSETSSIVFYFSDHGLSRYDNPNAPHQAAHGVSKGSLQIPFMVYMSDKFREQNPDIVQAIQKAHHKPFMTDLFTTSLMGLMGIQCNYTLPYLQLWSPEYDASRPRCIKGYGTEVRFSPKYPDEL